MSKFYTAVKIQGNHVLCKEVVDGKSRITKTQYAPNFYIPTKEPTPFKTMYGDPLKKVRFDTIGDARAYVKKYKDVSNHAIFGNTAYQYQFICDTYPGTIEFDIQQMGIWTLDIETEVSHRIFDPSHIIDVRDEFGNESKLTIADYHLLENKSSYTVYDTFINEWEKFEKSCFDKETSGFPHPAEAAERIQLVTMLNNNTKEYITWGLKKFDRKAAEQLDTDFDLSSINLDYRYFKTEEELLRNLLFWWKNTQIDGLTGWNLDLFDVPYLYNRIKNVLSEEAALSLSPFRSIKERVIKLGKREAITYDFEGIATLDYLPTYKKFVNKPRESYKLDFIGGVELKINKIDMGCTFKESYQDARWPLFVVYNLRDCDIVDRLEDKLGLIRLVYQMAYDAKCLPNDVYGAVRTWDCLIYRSLLEKNIVVPQKESVEGWSIEGAYVKAPITGFHHWIASFDAESLYPTIMMQYNMSPETIVNVDMFSVDVDGLLEAKYGLEFLKAKNYCMAANGQFFRTDVPGLFPEIIKIQFATRKKFKRMMKDAESSLELLKAKGVAPSDPEYIRLIKEIAKCDNIQKAKKILLNSLYGAAANEGFRFYDPRMAEGITMTGQYFIRAVGNAIDTYVSKIIGDDKFKATFYQDTDSCYVELAPIIEKFVIPALKGEKNVTKIIDAMDKISNDKITPAINAACNEIAVYTNSVSQLMNFKREALADRGVWCAKKKYALNVYDNEGVRYADPEVKVMGLEIVRSSTPAPCRKTLKDAVKIILTSDEAELQSKIAGWKSNFMSLPPEEIAFPRGVQNLSSYSDPDAIYAQGCPMQSRAALLFNHHVTARGLEDTYPLIQDSDKIKFVYLREPNKLRENVIGFVDKFPHEFEVSQHVDYRTMWEKAFIKPLDGILQHIGWNHTKQANLDSLFD